MFMGHNWQEILSQDTTELSRESFWVLKLEGILCSGLDKVLV